MDNAILSVSHFEWEFWIIIYPSNALIVNILLIFTS